ncbi:LysM peptidoglycan-binding domain-containing protein [Pseudomonadota bacterium]|nr:LysM peptidoglycan-binding domain-containing protein [Pseudomonadota bacterium]
MKVSKVIYFLFGGGVLAVVAILIAFYQPNLIEEKELVVPLVKEVVDAKTIEVKTSRKQNGETIKLEVIRVKPDGSLVIAGKGIPNSKIEIISGSTVITTTTSDKVGEFVAVPEKKLSGGEYFLSFKQTNKNGDVIIANETVAINVTGKKNDIPIVAIVDSQGKAGARVIQAPGLIEKSSPLEKDKNVTVNHRKPYIAILAMTYDTKIGQLMLSGIAHSGVQVNAGFSGKETSSTKILNDEWSLSIPGKLISGKQKIFAVLLGKKGEILSKNSINITGKAIQNANGKTLVIVQKGDALWNIAFNRLGLGNRYIDIVKLNKDKIDNPDLIYPKQLFVIPTQIKKNKK